MSRFLSSALLGAALMVPLVINPAAVRAEDKNYHDKGHNDDHTWNKNEDQAYRVWVKQNHRKYRTFDALPDADRESYWAWRHDHSDAVLNINIH